MSTTATNNPLYTKQVEEKILLAPFKLGTQLTRSKVKDVSKILQGYNFWFNVPDEKFSILSEIIEIKRTGIVMLENLERTFREVEPARTLPSQLNSAGYAGSVALYKTIQLHPQAPRIFIEEQIHITRGHFLELTWKDEFLYPSEEDYRRNCILLDGYSFRLVNRCMQLLTDKNMDLQKLNTKLTEFFTIYEDYLTVCSLKDPNGDMFRDGFLTFPVVHAIQTQNDANKIKYIFRKNPLDNNMRLYLFELLKNNGSLQYTKNVIMGLRDDVLKELEKFETNAHILELIENVVRNLD